MADTTYFRFRLRGGPAAEWSLNNPVLLEREPGVESDTGKFKLGDGIRAWSQLPYAGTDPAEVLAIAQQAATDATTPIDQRVADLEALPPGSYDDTALRGLIAQWDTDTLDAAKLHTDQQISGIQSYSLKMGVVSSGDTPAASLSGTAPNQSLNLVLPKGTPGQKGADGRGVSSITDIDANGTATITYSDGTTASLVLPRGQDGTNGTNGADGRGITSITDIDADGIATITYSDGLTASLVLPRGQDGTNGADGRGVASITDTDADGIATIAYSDGTTASLTLPRGQDGTNGTNGTNGADGRGVASITDTDADGIATITYSDGTTASLTLPKGQDGTNGADGRGVTSITDTDANGTATITYSDGTTASLVLPRGQDGTNGADGRGITSVDDPDRDGIATITFSDGLTSPLPLPEGPKGADGQGITINGSVALTTDLDTVDRATLTAGDAYLVDETGLLHIWDGTIFKDGVPFQGPAGADGKDGRGVSSITDIDADGIATITYTDGTTASLSLPRGQDGTNGTNGTNGTDGRGVSSIQDLDADGTATITYTDGTTAALPLPKGQDGTNGTNGSDGKDGRGVSSITDTDANGTATITYTDGTTAELVLPRGQDGTNGTNGTNGTDGRGVTSIDDTDADGIATVTYSDGQVASLPLPKGQDGTNGTNGSDGRGITSVTDTDANGTATITYSDGTTAELVLPRGQDGTNGTNGTDGRGVTSITDTDANGTATITYTDGTTAELVLPRGQDGTNGTDGVSVSSITDTDANGIATITYSNGTTASLTLPKGQDGTNGTDGRGVTSITDTDLNGTATITYSDGTTAELPLPPGQKGDPGTTEWTGITGKPLTFPPSDHGHDTADITDTAGTNLTDLLAAKFEKTGGIISGRTQVTPVSIGDTGEAAFRIDASASGLSSVPAFKVSLPASGERKAFQLTSGTDPFAWASFEWQAGGTNKPGFALGPGGGSTRDTNLYRDAANSLRTDDQFTANGVNANGNKVTGVAAPTADTDAATQGWTNTQLEGKASAARALPVGGASGQILSKSSATDYETQWIDYSAAAPAPVTGSSTFTASTEMIANPERGWYQYTETKWSDATGTGHVPLDGTAAVAKRTGTETVGGYAVPPRAVVFRYYVMEHMRGVDTIPQAFLDAVAADFAAARDAGVKLIARFSYSNDGTTGSNTDGNGPYGTDTTVARTLGHVAQLKPVIAANTDVIHALQAGFIGTWGEWYYTDNWGNKGSLTAADWDNRARLVTALLDWGVDFVLLRYVGLKRRYLREGTGTGWVAPVDAAARLGFHNDAFQASGDDSDWGTFNTFADGMTITEARAYLATETARPVPMVGETAGVSTRSTYAATAASLAEHHWSALNPNYHADVLASWTAAEKDEVSRKLGYRLRLTSATLPTSGGAGAIVPITLEITNDGWGHVLSRRPIQLVFTNATTTVARDLAVDIRTLGPGAHVITESISLPATDGTYALHLAMPDPTPALSTRGEYAIRLANATMTWADGRNALGVSTTVGGGVVSGVTDHGGLTGLSDDDHPQYALANGTRGDFASPNHSHDDRYYTENETDTLLNGKAAASQAVPTGGTTGQVLSKASATNNDVRWVSPPASPASVLLTTDPGNTMTGQWTKLATVRFSAQWQNISAKILLLSRDGTADDNSTAEIIWRVKQNDPLGGVLDDNAILASITANKMVNIAPDGIRTVLDVYTASSTEVSLWLRVDKNWERLEAFQQAITGQHAQLTYHSDQGFVATAPAGLAYWSAYTTEPKFWQGTESQYNALTTYDPDTTYYIVG